MVDAAIEFGLGDDLVDKTQFICSPGAHSASGHQIAGCRAHRDLSRKSKDAARTGDQSELRLEQREVRELGRDDDVAAECEFEAPPKA